MSRRKKGILIAKFGTKCLVNGEVLDVPKVSRHSKRYSQLIAEGYQLGIVSSGAKGAGKRRVEKLKPELSKTLDPRTLTAIGGASAYLAWQSGFENAGRLTAELRATHDNMDDPDEGKSLTDVFLECVESGIVPVFNINDPLDRYKDELGGIQEGKDNDHAAEHLSRKVGASTLMLLTAKKPGVIVDGKVEPAISMSDFDELQAHLTETDEEGSGSMRSKVQAAGKALEGGVENVFIGQSTADPREIIAGHKGTRVVQ